MEHSRFNQPQHSPQPLNSAFDLRVVLALGGAGILYDVTSTGDCRVSLVQHDGQTQRVIIGTRTFQAGLHEVRRVQPCGLLTKQFLSSGLMLNLLLRNSQSAFGAWRVWRTADSWAAIFAACISADAEACELIAASQVVGRTAYELKTSLPV